MQFYNNYRQNTTKTQFNKYFGNSISNFHKVDNYLCRGGQPTIHQLMELKNEGINTIICLNNNNDYDEERFVKSLGMEYIKIPLNLTEAPPQKFIKKFLYEMQIARNKNKKVFVHCKQGKDRTGFCTALYKIKYKLATTNEAIKEMLQLGHNPNINPYLIPLLKQNNF